MTTSVTDDEAISDAGESYKVFEGRGRLRSVAERAAEMAYRRGFQQGAWAVLKLLREGADIAEVQAYAGLTVYDWRYEATRQKWRWAKVPPTRPYLRDIRRVRGRVRGGRR